MPWYGECYDFSTIDVNRYDQPKKFNYLIKTLNDKAICNTCTPTGAILINNADTLTMNAEAFCIIFTLIYMFPQSQLISSMIQSNS